MSFIDNKPAFGPNFVYFYEGIHKNLFYGKLLISIETEEIDEKIVSPMKSRNDILMPTNESEYWDEEVFKINMILINVDGVNIQQHHRIKVYLSCEYNFSNSIDLDLVDYDKQMKVKFVRFSSNVRPLMSLSIKLPDNRLKLQVKNLISMLVQEMVKAFAL